MTVLYGLQVDVTGFDPKREELIKEALSRIWEFSYWMGDQDGIKAYGEDVLANAIDPEEYCAVFAQLLREVAGDCSIWIRIARLEDSPYRLYTSWKPIEANTELLEETRKDLVDTILKRKKR